MLFLLVIFDVRTNTEQNILKVPNTNVNLHSPLICRYGTGISHISIFSNNISFSNLHRHTCALRSALQKIWSNIQSLLSSTTPELHSFTYISVYLYRYISSNGAPKGGSKSRFHAGFSHKSCPEIAWNSCHAMFTRSRWLPDWSFTH